MATHGKHEGDKSSMTMKEAGHLGGKKVQHERELRDEKKIRHDAYDKPGPPKGTAFGIAAITQALEGLDFPVSKQELLAKAGHQRIEYRKDQPVELRPILEDLEDTEFPAISNVVQAISEALKEEGLSKKH